MTLIRCPWPPLKIWPNGSRNKFEKNRIAQSYKSDCHYLAKEQNVHKVKWPDGDIRIHIAFHPAGVPDDDNMEAAFKWGRDGIASAMGVDDKKFVVTRERGAKVKGGCVLVQILTEGVTS
jgi:crossover junction endodeoxyribonuclease RusA